MAGKKHKKSPFEDPDSFWNLARAETTDQCWEWPKHHTAAGYGRIWIYPKMIYAHRIAWQLTHGAIPDGLHVLHHCDNPPCVNPRHLFVGTAKDNARDMSDKGRAKNGMVKGIDHTLAKLTDDDVREIRRVYSPSPRKSGPFTSISLAAKYRVAKSLIYRIVKRQSWPHI